MKTLESFPHARGARLGGQAGKSVCRSQNHIVDLSCYFMTLHGRVLCSRVYKTPIRDIVHLQERLVEEGATFDNGIVERAVRQWRGRLRACIKAEGGHFEYQVQ